MWTAHCGWMLMMCQTRGQKASSERSDYQSDLIYKLIISDYTRIISIIISIVSININIITILILSIAVDNDKDSECTVGKVILSI